MTRTKKIIGALLFSSLIGSAHAGLELSLKAGPLFIGFDDVEVSEDPTSAAVSIGYSFDSVIRGLALEAEVSRTITPGTVIGRDLEVESQGLYIAYQTQGSLYLRGRVGYMDAELIAEGLSEAEGGETYGVGIGWQLQRFSVELDYTSIDDDISFVSLGLRF